MKPKTTYKRVGAWAILAYGKSIPETQHTYNNWGGNYALAVFKTKTDAATMASEDLDKIVPVTITYALPKALKTSKKK